jgi:hypothetical protein
VSIWLVCFPTGTEARRSAAWAKRPGFVLIAAAEGDDVGSAKFAMGSYAGLIRMTLPASFLAAEADWRIIAV